MPHPTTPSPHERMGRLLGYLERDPTNLGLLADAALAAREAHADETAADLLIRYEALSPLPPALGNLKGLIAIDTGRYEDAAGIFQGLLTGQPNEATLSFNLAWCRAMTADYAGALEFLTPDVLNAVAAAGALKVQMLHHQGRIDEALDLGMTLSEAHPHDAALAGAVSAVAIDAERVDLAQHFVALAGQNADGQATAGFLALEGQDPGRALDAFRTALAQNPAHARALLGRGLSALAVGDTAAAAPDLDRAAVLFEDHLGAWVAAGWARFALSDAAKARERFDKALALDDTFAETHGALAVLDILSGDLEQARRRTEVALRLDRRCLSAALAQSLLLDRAGDAGAAERVRQIALNAPLGPNGQTIAKAAAAFGRRTRGPN